MNWEKPKKKLYFEYGAMGAQKSAKLIATAYNYEETGRNVLVAKHSIDTRDEGYIRSRIPGLQRKVDLLIRPKTDIEKQFLKLNAKAAKEGREINVFLVDEVQFLSPKQVDQLFNIAVHHGVPVLAYGLRTDFKTHSFPGSKRLLEIAHVLRESITICGDKSCNGKAVFNARHRDGVFVNEGGQMAIEKGDISYTSLCDRHYFEHVGPIQAAESSMV